MSDSTQPGQPGEAKITEGNADPDIGGRDKNEGKINEVLSKTGASDMCVIFLSHILTSSHLHIYDVYTGLVYSEKGNLTEILCKPKIMPLKSLTLQKIEALDKEASDALIAQSKEAKW
jgi:hypothetical protein